jgi:hypothetical protein
MAIVLNGTTGLSGVDGSAGTPAIQGSDTNTGVLFPAADTVAISTGGSERLRVDSSGNLGLGVTPSAWSEGRAIERKFAGTADWGYLQAESYRTTNAYYNGGWKYGGTGAAASYAQVGAAHQWFSAASGTAGNTITFTQAMTLDASGNLLVGKTAPDNSERLGVKSSGATSSTYGVRFENSSATAIFLIRDDGYVRSPTTYNLTGGTANLSIDSSGYITRATSSLRYKTDIVDYDKGLAVVQQLRPVYYKSAVTDASGTVPDTQYAGLIAEEVNSLGMPEFVEFGASGEVESLRYGNMIALLTKAIQEQQVLIQSLTDRITQLEAK